MLQIKEGTKGCPHCGDNEGFVTSRIYRTSHLYAWDLDGSAECDGDTLCLKETDPRCVRCGKAVRSVVKVSA